MREEADSHLKVAFQALCSQHRLSLRVCRNQLPAAAGPRALLSKSLLKAAQLPVHASHDDERHLAPSREQQHALLGGWCWREVCVLLLLVSLHSG